MGSEFCRVCGDRFGVWLGPTMTDGLCPMTQATGLCERARERAHAEGTARKVCPEAFDENGSMKRGHLVQMIDAMHARGLDPWTGLPLKAAAAVERGRD
jgi:hypothetical protein